MRSVMRTPKRCTGTLTGVTSSHPHELLHIFSEQVRLQIDAIPHVTLMEGRHLQGVRDDPDAESAARHRSNRQSVPWIGRGRR